jgi:drug/metabolite transporter (DMT)-like permease
MNRIPAPCLPAIAAISWGAMFPIAHNAFPHVDPFNITAIRYLGAAVIFAALLYLVEGRAAFSFEGRAVRSAWLGTLGFAGFNLLAYVGLSHTEPQNAAVLITTMPLVAVIVRWYRTGERPEAMTFGLIVFAIAGVALLVTNGSLNNFNGGFGDLLVLGAVICWVLYTTSAAETPNWSPLRFTTLTALPGALAIVLLTAIADAAGWQTLPSSSDVGAVLPAIAFIIIFGAVIAVLSWNAGVRRLGAPNATLFIIQIAQGAHPSAAEFIGAGMILGALVATNVHARHQARSRQAPQGAAVVA